MASGRRGGPPDFKNTLSSLLRATLEQVEVVKDVALQQTKGTFLENALQPNQYKEALQKLGEVVLRLSHRGELGDLALHPTICELLAQVEDAGGTPSDISAPKNEAISSKDFVRPGNTPEKEFRVWRPSTSNTSTLTDAEEAEQAPSSPRSTREVMHQKNNHQEVRFSTGKSAENLSDYDDLKEYMHEDDVS